MEEPFGDNFSEEFYLEEVESSTTTRRTSRTTSWTPPRRSSPPTSRISSAPTPWTSSTPSEMMSMFRFQTGSLSATRTMARMFHAPRSYAAIDHATQSYNNYAFAFLVPINISWVTPEWSQLSFCPVQI